MLCMNTMYDVARAWVDSRVDDIAGGDVARAGAAHRGVVLGSKLWDKQGARYRRGWLLFPPSLFCRWRSNCGFGRYPGRKKGKNGMSLGEVAIDAYGLGGGVVCGGGCVGDLSHWGDANMGQRNGRSERGFLPREGYEWNRRSGADEEAMRRGGGYSQQTRSRTGVRAGAVEAGQQPTGAGVQDERTAINISPQRPQR